MATSCLCNTCGKRVQLRSDGTFRQHGAFADQYLAVKRPACLASRQRPASAVAVPAGWTVERRFNGFCAIIVRPPAVAQGFAIPTVEHVKCRDRDAAVRHLFGEARKLLIG